MRANKKDTTSNKTAPLVLTPEALAKKKASVTEHHFKAWHYVLSSLFNNVLVAIVAATFFVVPIRPAQCWEAMAEAGGQRSAVTPPHRVFWQRGVDWNSIACSLVDWCIWTYALAIVLSVAVKWRYYKGRGWHYFILDYCYFHSALLVVFFIYELCEGSVFDGSFRFISMEHYAYNLAQSPNSDATRWSVIRFFGLMGGSFGAILTAVYIWGNALVYQDLDRMSSCFVHFGPATIQAIFLHFLGHSPASKIFFGPAAPHWLEVLKWHFACFVGWQIFHYGFIAVRKLVRGGSASDVDPSYTYLMQKPPMGKNGPLYRFVTCLGPQVGRTKVLFVITQWFLHILYFMLGYFGVCHCLCVSVAPYRTWVLWGYICLYQYFATHAAGRLTKNWIRKLQTLAIEGLEAAEIVMKKDQQQQQQDNKTE